MRINKNDLKNELKKYINETKISDDITLINSFKSDASLEKGTIPDLIMYPAGEDDIIRILEFANNYNIPIIPSSSKEKYYGGTIPKNGGIIIDLSKMNEILEINTEDRYVWIEPGVTYEQLIPELKKHGLRIMVPLGFPPSASVVSTYIDRVPLLTGPKILISEGWQCILNIHLILANGMPLDTGTASWCKERPNFLPSGAPGGPDLSRLFSGSQGTLGIVTQLIIKAKYLPKNKKVIIATFNNLNSCINSLNKILWYDKVREILIISKKNLSFILTGSESFKNINQIKSMCPDWLLVLGIEFDSKEKYMLDLEDLKDFGVKYNESLTINKINLNEFFLREFKLPRNLNNFRYFKDALHIPFYINGDKINNLNEGIEKIASKYNYSLDDLLGYVMPIEQGHTYFLDYTIHYNKSEDDLKQIEQFFMEISKYLLNNGGVIDRPYGIWAELIFSNNPGLFQFLKQIKKQLDPNNILNPGRLNL
ncbi:MAG: FAD-binding oxidoreductase [Candidatus Helarchaeota archaeon]